MRKINACLKLNFLCRKFPIIIGIALLFILCIKSINRNIGMSDGAYVIESLFLMIYAAYNYKSSFAHWISIGGRRKDFYLSNFILYTFTAAVLSYVQTLIFIKYISRIPILLGDYGKFSLLQVANFTPLELWVYLFFSFMCSVLAGNFLGALNIRFDLGEALAMSFGYFFGTGIVFMAINKMFEDTTIYFIINQVSIYLFQIICYAFSAYISWRIIREEELCTE